MAKRNGEKHFGDDGIVIVEEYGESAFIGAIDDYPSKNDFLDGVRSLYQEEFDMDDIEITHVAWRADFLFIVKFGTPCGWMEVEKGARGSFPCWKIRRRHDGR